MSEYHYPDDGKLHTRFSELKLCTPGSVEAIVRQRLEQTPRFESEHMRFGTTRHELWQEEAEQTHKLPRVFGLDWAATHIEQEFTTEILPGVVVHSRVDVLCAEQQTVCDYKTVVDGVKGYKKNLAQYKHGSRQLTFYAFQVGLNGVHVRQGAYLCEIWNQERDTILGYEKIVFPISLLAISNSLEWVKRRAALLLVEMDHYKQTQGVLL